MSRRAVFKLTAQNGNGMGMPLTIAVQLLPTQNTMDGMPIRSADAIAAIPPFRDHRVFIIPSQLPILGRYMPEDASGRAPSQREARHRPFAFRQPSMAAEDEL